MRRSLNQTALKVYNYLKTKKDGVIRDVNKTAGDAGLDVNRWNRGITFLVEHNIIALGERKRIREGDKTSPYYIPFDIDIVEGDRYFDSLETFDIKQNREKPEIVRVELDTDSKEEKLIKTIDEINVMLDVLIETLSNVERLKTDLAVTREIAFKAERRADTLQIKLDEMRLRIAGATRF